MRLHRFYVEQELQPLRETIILDAELLHQWSKVFRLRAGDDIILFNGADHGSHEYFCRIISIARKQAVVSVGEAREIHFRPKRELWLMAALVKKDNFEWILQKGTELGVTHFVPLLTDRSEKKDFNSDRLKKIVIEATEQSGRGSLPEIHGLIAPERALEHYLMPSIVFDPKGEPLVSNQYDFPQLALYLGPEGGWSDRELEIFNQKKIALRSLGTQTLRAETAAVAVCSLFLLS